MTKIKASDLKKNWGEDLIKRVVFDNPKQQLLQKFDEMLLRLLTEYTTKGDFNDKKSFAEFCRHNLIPYIEEAISQTEKETRQNTLKEIEATTKEMAKMIEKVYMKFDREDFCEEPNSVCPGCNGCKTYEELSKLFIKLHKKSLVG